MKKLARPIIVVLVVFVAFWSVTNPSNAQTLNSKRDLSWLTESERQWLIEHPVIRVAPTPHFPPFEYWEGTGKESEFKGVVSSYLKHFEKELGVRFKMVRTETWRDNLEQLKSTQIDAVSLIVPWTDRDYVEVSDPYVIYPSVIVVRKQDPRDLSLKDLVGKKVAVPDGYTGMKFLIQNYPKIITVPVKDPAEGIRKVSMGEVDAFFGGAAVVAYLAEREGLTNLRIAGESDFQYQNGFGVRSDWAPFAKIISKTLARITPAQKSAFHATWVSEGFFRKRFFETKKFWWVLGSFTGAMFLGTGAMVVWNRKQAAFIDQLEIEKKRTEEARHDAESANEAKSAFVATISHEIRTPMNGVLGMCELLRGTRLNGQQAEYLEFAHGSAENLVGLINDILDFSKMEAGKLELELEPFDLAKLLDDVITLMKTQTRLPLKRKQELELLLEKADNVSDHYVGDPLRIRQVLLNLISNSIKFTEKGYVKVKVTLEDSQSEPGVHLVRFAVEDTGIGVAQEKLTDIFEPFEQEQTSTTRRFGGTGLGLSICKTLAELMGGTAFATSEKGKGSVFGFTAKLQPTSESAVPVEVDATEVAATRSCSVLLAEDGLVNQKVAIGLLESRGHKVQLVETGLAALEALEKETYDAVLMDIEMPGMDGLTAIRKIREREKVNGNRQRVFAITGHGMKGDRERCLAAGMDGHLVKPFKPHELYAAVEQSNRQHDHEHSAPTLNASTDQVVKIASVDNQRPDVLDRRQALETTGGDTELTDILRDTCIQESPKILEQAKQAVIDGDFLTAKRCGHSLASSFGAIGAMNASKAANKLQKQTSNNEQEFNKAIKRVEAAFQELCLHLDSAK